MRGSSSASHAPDEVSRHDADHGRGAGRAEHGSPHAGPHPSPRRSRLRRPPRRRARRRAPDHVAAPDVTRLERQVEDDLTQEVEEFRRLATATTRRPASPSDPMPPPSSTRSWSATSPSMARRSSPWWAVSRTGSAPRPPRSSSRFLTWSTDGSRCPSQSGSPPTVRPARCGRWLCRSRTATPPGGVRRGGVPGRSPSRAGGVPAPDRPRQWSGARPVSRPWRGAGRPGRAAGQRPHRDRPAHHRVRPDARASPSRGTTSWPSSATPSTTCSTGSSGVRHAASVPRRRRPRAAARRSRSPGAPRGARRRPERAGRDVALVTDELDRMGRYVDDLLLLAKAEQPDFLALGRSTSASWPASLPPTVRGLGDRRVGAGRGAVRRTGRGRGRLEPRSTQAMLNLADQRRPAHRDGRRDRSSASRRRRRRVALVGRATRARASTPASAEHIFERFPAARAGRERRPDGTGLGLSIVARHRRRPTAAASRLTDPPAAAPRSPSTIPVDRARGGTAGGRPMTRILIAEDEERIVSFLEKGLRASGYATAGRRRRRRRASRWPTTTASTCWSSTSACPAWTGTRCCARCAAAANGCR